MRRRPAPCRDVAHAARLLGLVQPERRVGHADRLVGPVQLDDDGDLDLGGADELDVDARRRPAPGRAWPRRRCGSSCRRRRRRAWRSARAPPPCRPPISARTGSSAFDGPAGVALRHGEGQVGDALAADVLDDHVDDDVRRPPARGRPSRRSPGLSGMLLTMTLAWSLSAATPRTTTCSM